MSKCTRFLSSSARVHVGTVSSVPRSKELAFQSVEECVFSAVIRDDDLWDRTVDGALSISVRELTTGSSHGEVIPKVTVQMLSLSLDFKPSISIKSKEKSWVYQHEGTLFLGVVRLVGFRHRTLQSIACV